MARTKKTQSTTSKEAIIKRLSRRFKLDAARVKEYKSYDDMVDMKWELPSGLAEKNWSVKFVDPIAHDAEKVASNFFDTYHPQVNVLPFGPEDQANAEEKERFLEWHMMRANRHGDTEPFREMLRHSIRYDRVAAQLDYLPYWLPSDHDQWTQAQKEAVYGGPFMIYVHDTKTVYYEMGPYGLRWVAKIANMSVSEVLDHWLIYPQANTDKLSAWMDKNDDARVVMFDYTDMTTRYVGAWLVENSKRVTQSVFNAEADERTYVEILNVPNDLGFINWAIASGSSGSLFESLHRGNLWLNANLTKSVIRSDVYRRSFYPLGIEEGVGDDIEIDYSGDQITYKVPPGKKLTPIQRPPIDPGWAAISADDQAMMAQSTSIQTLSGVQPHSNVQFATVNAFIQLSLTSLEPYKRTAEKAFALLCGLVFKWMMAMGKDGPYSEIALRTQKTKTHERGGKIMLSTEDFDPEHLFVDVSLIPNTPTDRLQLANIALQLIQARMPIPMEEHMDRLGYSNTDVLKQKYYDEQIEMAALANFLKEQDPQFQMMMQQQQQQAEMEMAKQQAEAAAQSQGQPMIPEGQAANPAGGGMPPAMGAPAMTKTQIPGGGAISNPGGMT